MSDQRPAQGFGSSALKMRGRPPGAPAQARTPENREASNAGPCGAHLLEAQQANLLGLLRLSHPADADEDEIFRPRAGSGVPLSAFLLPRVRRRRGQEGAGPRR